MVEAPISPRLGDCAVGFKDRVDTGVESVFFDHERGCEDDDVAVAATAADEDALSRLCANYIDNVRAYTQREKVRNRYTGNYEEPDERLMRSVEEKIDIPEGRKDDFRREIMN